MTPQPPPGGLSSSSSSTGIQLQNAYSNLFRASSSFAQIPYRVFVSLTGDRSSLLQAEWSIRQSNSKALVQTVNNELWVFSFSDSTTPPPPPVPSETFKLTETSTGTFLASTLITSSLDNTSSTTAPTSNSSTTATSATAPGPYLPFLAAVRSLITSNLASPDLFIPFGQSLISISGRGLLHIEPILTASGELIIKEYYENTRLIPINGDRRFSNSRNGESKISPLPVYLAPSGIPGVIIENSLKPPPNVSIFVVLFELATSSEFASSDRYLLKEWVKIRLVTSNKIVLWPADLCFTVSAITLPDGNLDSLSVTGNLEPTISSLAAAAVATRGDRDIDWSEIPQIFDQAERQIELTRSVLSKRMLNKNQQQPQQQQQQQQSQQQLQLQQLQQLQLQQLQQRSNLSVSGTSVAGSAGISTVYPTPPDPQVRVQQRTSSSSRMDINEPGAANWVTPGANMTNETWGDLDEELFGDEQEITEADFNFFDEPDHDPRQDIKHDDDDVIMNDTVEQLNDNDVSDSKKQLPSSNKEETNLVKEEPISSSLPISSSPPIKYEITKPSLTKSSMVRLDIDADNDENDDDFDEDHSLIPSLKRRRKSVFAALTFNKLISTGIDSKYGIGGRFFVPLPEDSDEEDDDDDSNEDDDNELVDESLSNSDKERAFSETVDKPSDDKRTPISLNNEQQQQQPQQTPQQAVEYSNDWLQLMTQNIAFAGDVGQNASPNRLINLGDNSITKNIGNSNDGNNLLTLLEQIVWDNGMLSQFVPRKQPLEVPDATVLRKTMSMFPCLASITISDLLRMSIPNSTPGIAGTAAINASSSTPATAGADSNIGATATNSSNPMSTEMKGIAKVTEEIVQSVSADPISSSSLVGNSTSSSTSHARLGGASADTISKLLPNDAFPISAPLFSIRRLNQPMKARAPILRFWKIFGLSPRNGPKNIILIMLCPPGDGMISYCKAYADFLKSTYEGCGLGNVILGEFSSYRDGVVPVLNPGGGIVDGGVLGEIERLSDSSIDRKIVVLTTNRPSDISSLVSVSNAISSLRHKNSVVWQSINIDKVAATDAIVVPSQYSAVRLSLAIYDKCILDNNNGLCRTTPSFTLSRMPPPKISFKLTMDAPVNLMDEDSLLHVSYAMSDDGRWVTVAWSDQWGELSMVDAICLKRAGSRPRGLEEICAEIWDKTIALASRRPNHWRVILAKVGPRMDGKELSIWLRLSETINSNNATASSATSNTGGVTGNNGGASGRRSSVSGGGNSNSGGGGGATLKSSTSSTASSSSSGGAGAGIGHSSQRNNVSFLYIVCVYCNSPLVIHGSSIFPYEKFEQASRTIVSLDGKGTPVTPQRGINDIESPDMYGINIATPSSGHNPVEGDKQQHDTTDDIVMVDVKDDAYGVLLHDAALQLVQGGFDQGGAAVSKPAIVGLLLKPPAVTGSHVLLRLQVSMVHSPTSAPMMMKSLLVQYRRLASLGEATGVSIGSSVIPWHVEACDKMLRVLNSIE